MKTNNLTYLTMKKNLILCLIILTITLSFGLHDKKEQNSDSKAEWISLFDGKTFDGWHQFNKSEMSPSWYIKNGEMIFDPKLTREKSLFSRRRQVQNIVTEREFKNFELSLEWKISKKGNSGIFWAVKEGDYEKPYQTGPEIQILDNKRHRDAFINPKFHQAGALYDLVQPTSDVCNPAGEWNHVLIYINHNSNKGIVKLNDFEIVSFPLSGPEWDSLVSNSKFGNDEQFKDFGKFKTGKIGLQDHGDKVSFRNIKIREM